MVEGGGLQQRDPVASPSASTEAYRAETRRDVLLFCLTASVLLLFLGLASLIIGWTVAAQRGWLWFVFILPYVAVVVGVQVGGREPDPMRFQRLLRWLIAPVVACNLVELVLLIVTPLAAPSIPSPSDELVSSIVLYGVNIVVFGLWFWVIDCGGPISRALTGRDYPDFLFPQDDSDRVPEGWHPRLSDYMFIALTNATAFSPSDAVPMTGRAKFLMALESVTVLVFILTLGVVLATT